MERMKCRECRQMPEKTRQRNGFRERCQFGFVCRNVLIILSYVLLYSSPNARACSKSSSSANVARGGAFPYTSL